MAARLSRIKKELEMLATDPGPGISAWPVDDSNMMRLEAQIQGPQESPYQEGLYTLSLDIPDRYPFEPPRVRFLTPIYHPNIDSEGRICLDTLKMQPHGSWSPSVNINTLLLTIRVLMSNPNADDGLVPDITEEYKRDVSLWRRKALEHTRLNALPKVTAPSPMEQLSSSSKNQPGTETLPKPLTIDREEVAAINEEENSEDDDESDEDDDEEEEDEDDEDIGNITTGKRFSAFDDSNNEIVNSKIARPNS
jgi:ubiquitin-conjugating enzyme E2 T